MLPEHAHLSRAALVERLRERARRNLVAAKIDEAENAGVALEEAILADRQRGLCVALSQSARTHDLALQHQAFSRSTRRRSSTFRKRRKTRVDAGRREPRNGNSLICFLR